MSNDAKYVRESILYLHHFLKKNLQIYADQYDITIPQMGVLNEVLKRQNISVKEISKNLNMTHSTVSAVVDRLIQKAILVKEPNPNDKRSVNISVSKPVSDYLKENQADIINKSMADILENLDSKQKETVLEGLQILRSAAERLISDNKTED